MRVCSISYAACNAHASYYIVIYGLYGYTFILFFFFILRHKRHDLREKSYSKWNVFWFSLQLLSETFLILAELSVILSQMHTRLHIKYYPLFLSDFNGSWYLSPDFLKILKYQISWKSVQWEAAVACGETDRDMGLTVNFLNFAKAPKKTLLLNNIHIALR